MGILTAILTETENINDADKTEKKQFLRNHFFFWRAARVQGRWLFQGARLSAIAAEFLSLYGSTGGKPFTERFSFRPFESLAVLKKLKDTEKSVSFNWRAARDSNP